MLMASSIIDKKLPRRECRQEHRATDLRRRTRVKRSSLSLGRLDLSSYYLFHALEDGHFTKREILSACLERSLGDPCDDELLSANNPRPEIRRDKANQWAEHCESNSDARNCRSGKLLIGRDRHALQTQFPTSRIELRDCHQLRLRNLHSPSIAAAAMNPTATPITGLMPQTGGKNSSVSFRSWNSVHGIFSSVRRSTFQKP